MSGHAVWKSARRAYEIRCRPRSVHGSFCEVSPAPSGLQVRVYARQHGSGTTGHLSESFVAKRCAAR